MRLQVSKGENGRLAIGMSIFAAVMAVLAAMQFVAISSATASRLDGGAPDTGRVSKAG